MTRRNLSASSGHACSNPVIALWLALSLPLLAHGASAPAINPGAPWPATDALGRAVPPGSEVPAPRADRFVGIFYFLTAGRDSDRLPNDLAKILPQDPDLLKKPD